MKKIIAFVLVVVFCLSLSACGKSEAVKNVEAMIDALGEITLESIDAIRAAENAYAVLTMEEQEKVKNYEALTTARDRYYELALVGEWCWSRVYLYELDSSYERVDIILNADMTAVDMVGTAQEFTAKWSVKDSRLVLTGEGIGSNYDVVETDGNIRLKASDIDLEWMTRNDYLAMLDDAFLIVDMSKADLTNYFGLKIHDLENVDEWGDPTGYHFLGVILTNQLYDQGWLYLNSSDDFAVEILYPEFQKHYIYQDGSTWDSTKEAGTHTFGWNPFDFQEGLYLAEYDTADHTATSNLDAEQISFGRAKGTIAFINSKYVSEIKPSEDGRSRVLITDFSKDGYLSGRWFEGIQY